MNGHFGGGKGTLSNPYLIEDIWDFNNIRIFPNKSFKLTRNINFATSPFDKGFLPIQHFEGQLDGNGYKLLNVYIEKSNIDSVGIFSTVDLSLSNYTSITAPFIKNIIIENAKVIGTQNIAGILIGKMNYRYNVNAVNYSEYFNNIYISGTVSGKNFNGALIGYLYFEHNNYSNIFAKNIQTNVLLKPQLNLTYNSPLFGYVQSNAQNYLNSINLVVDSIIDAKINITGITLSMPNCNIFINSNVVQNDTYHYQFKNVIAKKDSWNGEHSTYLTEKFNDEINLSCKMEDFKASLTEQTKWKFIYNTVPKLSMLNKNLIYIYANDKFYTYNNDSKTFNQIYIYDYEQALNNQNINFLDSMDNGFYKLLKETFGTSCKIVNIINKNNGFTITGETNVALTRDTSKDYNNKHIYTQKINFSSFTGDIDSIIEQ